MENLLTSTSGRDECRPQVAVVIAVGPGRDSALDTLASIHAYCQEPHTVIIIDDHTTDGTYEALKDIQKPNWKLFRNRKNHGANRLVHTLCFGYKQAVTSTECSLILKMDVDALMIKPGLISEAQEFLSNNPLIGMFGVYETDYNRPRSFSAHSRLIEKETAWYRGFIGQRPYWQNFLPIAEKHGYAKGDNVFGGSYFITRKAIISAMQLGALDIPWHWHSKMQEDVYFSMVTIASGFRLGHFAAPDGPLWMEWRGLPYPAQMLASGKAKLIHSVDKGKNTGTAENGGRTARQVFSDLRNAVL